MVFTATHDDVDELISGQLHYAENNLSCHTRQLLYCVFCSHTTDMGRLLELMSGLQMLR